MGADFIYAICPLPPRIDETVKLAIKERVNIAATDYGLVRSILEEYSYDFEEELERKKDELTADHLFEIDEIDFFFMKEMFVELIEEALEEVVFSRTRRDVGELILDHKLWLISGGMSWGDSPCEAMRYIDLLELTKILDGLNNYSN